MNFNFDWNCVSAGAPYVTISELSLSFNMSAISLLDNPERIVIGFDEEKMAIGIKDAKNITNTKSYNFFSRMRNGWIRIGCRDFIKYLSLISGIKFSPAKKFLAQYDKENQILYIIVNEKEAEEDKDLQK